MPTMITTVEQGGPIGGLTRMITMRSPSIRLIGTIDNDDDVNNDGNHSPPFPMIHLAPPQG